MTPERQRLLAAFDAGRLSERFSRKETRMSIAAEKIKALFPRPRVAALLAVPELTIHWEEIPFALMQTLVEGPALIAEGGRIVAIVSPMFRPGFDWSKLLTTVLDPLAAEWPTIYAEGGKLVQIWQPVFGTPAA